ncbi:hypothetical protein D3C80_1041330 [compost metagenome]
MRMLFAALPVIWLARALPVPLMAAVPVRNRFSKLAPRVWVIAERMRSTPAEAASVTLSAALSMT